MPEPTDKRPSVTVILPARNEESNIRAAVESLAAQTLPVEIVAVDDDSSDRTGAILDELARTFSRLKVIHNRGLPQGWIGKNHACWLGAEQATGEWLLFTDADVQHAPEAVETGLALASEQSVGLVSFSPDQEMHTWWERSAITAIYLRLAALYPYWKVNDPNRPDAAASGAWLLISRALYESIGGHRAIRQEILEDVELARLVKRSGARLHFAPARGLARTRMYRSFGEMWEGWSKNLFLLHRGRRGAALIIFVTIFGPILLWAAVLLGWRISTVGVLAGLVAVHLVAAGDLAWRKLPPVNALYLFPGLHLLSALMLSSWIRHRWRGEVTWKGRSYTVTVADSSGKSSTSETRQTK